jgi:predicted TIM-barrel fold metal-dependent hydrolase
VGAAALTKAGGQTLPVVCDLLFSGIFARFPRLRVVLVESNIGWIPTLLEQADDMFMRYRWYTRAVEQQRAFPSEIFHRNFWATFMVDTVGMDLRHRMNLDHLMWSTDYPHSGSDWPNSRVTIERVFRDVPRHEVKKMLHTNCKELYRLDHLPERLPALGRPR